MRDQARCLRRLPADPADTPIPERIPLASGLARDPEGHRQPHAIDPAVVAARHVLTRAMPRRVQITVLLGLEGQQRAVGGEARQQTGLQSTPARDGPRTVRADGLPVHDAAGLQRLRPERALQQPAAQRDLVEGGRAALIDHRPHRQHAGLHLHAAVDPRIPGPCPQAGPDAGGGIEHQRGHARARGLAGGGGREALAARTTELPGHLQLDDHRRLRTARHRVAQIAQHRRGQTGALPVRLRGSGR